MNRRLAWTTALAVCAALATAQTTARERAGLVEALFYGNMTAEDLGFTKRSMRPAGELATVTRAIERPLDSIDGLLEFHPKAASGTASGLIRQLAQLEPLLFGGVSASPREAIPAAELEELPVPVRKPVERLVGELTLANRFIRSASEGLSAEERRELIESLPVLAVETSAVRFSFSDRTTVDRERVQSLLRRVNVQTIVGASRRLAEAVEQTLPELRESARTAGSFQKKLRIGGLIVDIAGTGNDVHEATDAVLTIDLGGRDRYSGRHGAGVGYASVMIDLGGNDEYDVPDLSLGAGILGAGIAYDLGGNDTFRTRSLALGSAMAGMGIFSKSGGDDLYSSESLSQGFAYAGLALLLDEAGDDRYSAGAWSQGSSASNGVAWFVDRRGDDSYRAEGRAFDPAATGLKAARSQGYSAGGVGLLTDLLGNDTYDAGSGAQGAATGGVGSLFDAAGNDSYVAGNAVQGASMGVGGAYLFDLSGDDIYAIRLGSGHGFGFDGGSGVLLDRAGNDVYSASDSRPGSGSLGGVGIFLDSAGDDRYLGFGGTTFDLGDTFSIGLFIDLDGSDKFADNLTDRFAIVGTTGGIAVDLAPTVGADSTGDAPSPPLARPVPGSIGRPSDTDLANLFRRASEGPEAESSLNQLIAIGMPALQWMIEKRLSNVNVRERGIIAAVAGAIGPEGRALIASRIGSESPREAENAFAIAVQLRAPEAAEYVGPALERPAVRQLAARAAGKLGARALVPRLMELAGGEDKRVALAATLSLAELADETVLSTAQALLGARDYPLRKAAARVMASVPTRGAALARTMLTEGDEGRARSAAEVLALIGTPEALDALGALLSDPRAGLRVSALLGLADRCPPAFRSAFERLRSDPDPRVAAVAARLDTGR